MPNVEEHTRSLWKSLEKHQLFLACSGGIDSMVLLDLLVELKYSVNVIHVNYQLRGKESDADEALVRRVCASHNVTFFSRTVDIKSRLEQGGNLQQLARDVRYEWFNEILTENSNNRVLLAHHQDDQIETFFQNLARKSGILGLSCMKDEHAGIVRPLLHFSKAEIIAYARKHHLEWREDASNASNTYARNRLRNEFLPFVYAEIPTLRESVLELIDQFQATQLELETSISPFLDGIHTNGKLSRADFLTLTHEKQVELMRQLDLAPTLVPRLLQLTQRGTRVPVEDSIVESIVLDQNDFTFLKKEIALPHIQVKRVDFLPETFDKSSIYLDADKLKGELKVRLWELGDRISPIGMKGSQLISDIIKDAKIDSDAKKSVSILHDDETIHWCVGLKIGRLACATATSTHIICCSITDSRVEE